ncbi:MAG: (2Fe-2S)-binding protein [Phycisphaerales bacterium]|nr:(2Fe-2S)-binding protein [Phycisphaerales bacterium]
MAKIILNNQEVETREGIPVLQAALEAGLNVPHYCYHPGLSVVASCRLCLMEMKMPHPKTGELGWAPKLMPSCQTPVRDGMEVRFDSDKVHENQERCMEFFLLNHPLDCPVCDQAGECHLQDYSYHFGKSESRMVDQKHVTPKKDVGPRTLLYSDRCVMCSRCVRFCDEVAGTGELCITNRGSKAEIDAFPGKPLDNPMQGNVVDICPVGCLLDKDFLFQQRVWFLKSADSICTGCSTGCSIRIDQNEDHVHRLKPRFNPRVNQWWMCDEGRFGFKYIHDKNRLTRLRLRRGESFESLRWESLAETVRYRFENIAKKQSDKKIAVVLSPFMACEEAWLLVKTIREVAPEATLVLGPVPTVEQDERFPVGATNGDTKFIIRKEKCPNRNGIELIIKHFGGNTETFDAFVEQAGAGEFAAAWISGGYPTEWVGKDFAKAAGKIPFKVVHDLFGSALTEEATLVIPACSFAERDGTFVNATGVVQPFARAIKPPQGCKRDGQFFYELAELEGLYQSPTVLGMMAAEIDEFKEVYVPPQLPEHQH